MSIVEITLAYIIGIKWGLYQDIKVLVGFLIFLLIFTLIYKKEKINFIIILAIICLFGCVYSNGKYEYMESKYNNKDIKINMTITSHEEVSSSGYSYKYHVKSSEGDKFILYVKLKDENLFDIGTEVVIEGEFIQPDVARNRGGFDYKKYLYSNNIYGTINASSVKVVEDKTKNIVYILQNKIRKNMLQVFDKETAGILIGMIIGETNDISKITQENFKASRRYSFTCGIWC